MIEARGIETLSVSFTAGVIAGTMLSAGGPLLPCLLLMLIVLPFFLQGKLMRMDGTQSLAILMATFLLLGIFCAWNALQPGVGLQWVIQDWADATVGRLRASIDTLPFRDPGTPALLRALLTGDRSGLSRETVAVFRESGASHVLALSGLHIGIIYLIFDKLTRVLGQTPVARRIRFGLIVLGAGFFTLMTGAGASIVRAFLFIVINETLRLLGRPRKAVRVLCLALLVQLVLDPAAIAASRHPGSGLPAQLPGHGGDFSAVSRAGGLVPGVRFVGPPAQDMDHGGPEHQLPIVYRSLGLAAFPQLPQVLPAHQPAGHSPHHRPHGHGRHHGASGAAWLVPRPPYYSNRRPLPPVGLGAGSHCFNVKPGLAHSVMEPSGVAEMR